MLHKPNNYIPTPTAHTIGGVGAFTLHTISRVRGEKKLWYVQEMHIPQKMESIVYNKVVNV